MERNLFLLYLFGVMIKCWGSPEKEEAASHPGDVAPHPHGKSDGLGEREPHQFQGPQHSPRWLALHPRSIDGRAISRCFSSHIRLADPALSAA